MAPKKRSTGSSEQVKKRPKIVHVDVPGGKCWNCYVGGFGEYSGVADGRNIAVANHVTMLAFVLLARHSMMIRQFCGLLFVRSV